MNRSFQAAIAAAAVLVVAVVGYNLLPGHGGIGGPPTPSPTLTTAAAKSAPVATEPWIPAAGPLAVGRHPMTLEGVRFTFQIASAGWTSGGDFGFGKEPIPGPTGASFIVWQQHAAGIFSDPCGHKKAPPAGPSAADMASAIVAVPGTELVTGPTAVTIGGKPAQYVAIKIPDKIACVPEAFFLWYDTSNLDNERYATAPGSTIRVWIIDVDGKRVQLDAETYKGAGAGPGQEIQQIIDSIQFE